MFVDFNMDLKSSHMADEKHLSSDDEKGISSPAYPGAGDHHEVGPGETRELSRALKGRHMQMIAIGMLFQRTSIDGFLAHAQRRWFDRCWALRWVWRCAVHRGAWKSGMFSQASLASRPSRDKLSARLG